MTATVFPSPSGAGWRSTARKRRLRRRRRVGLGFCRGPWAGIRDDVEAGRLVTFLEDYELDDLGIYAVYAHREQLPAKIRAFIDHLVDYFETERKAGRAA